MEGSTADVRALLMSALAAALPLCAGAQEHPEHASPYAGHRDREIKALSQDEVEGLLAGEGMGFALPAELNGNPGPKHVLELADELGLTPGQLERTRAVENEMSARARALGAELVDAERALDRAFADGTISADGLTEMTSDVGSLRAKLRAVHLSAHLNVTEILTRRQRHLYQRLRGYGGGHGMHPPGP